MIEKFKEVGNEDFIGINNIESVKGDGIHFSKIGHETMFYKVK